MNNEREQFEEHIKSAAWYRVLSEAAKDDDEGASVFRMARMAASEAWQASRRAALEEGYALGFKASGEGWNGEYPNRYLTQDPFWLKERDENLSAAISLTSP